MRGLGSWDYGREEATALYPSPGAWFSSSPLGARQGGLWCDSQLTAEAKTLRTCSRGAVAGMPGILEMSDSKEITSSPEYILQASTSSQCLLFAGTEDWSSLSL